MPYGLYISAEGAYVQSERLKVVANNLANVDSSGFKRDVAVFQARYSEADQRGLDQPGSGTLNDLSGGVLLSGTMTDFSPGTLKNTGRETDLAIDGDGFFVVRRDGKDFLTRAGNFSIGPNGALVTQSGEPVMAADGGPIVIDPEAGPWTFSPDGSLQQAGTVVPLAIVRPQHVSDLAKAGDNLFMPLAKPQPVPPTERHVAAGFLEGSGVRPTLEMMELIEASRAFEANTTMIKTQDTMLGTLISQVLKDT